ncbi:alpha/beta fold hydrolase [Salinarimonas sp.]|uniref:alpha/beta fold hydrolase n=1 Tax=Salinarimonas sp. TaxID=2766526 RepID=UPI0032D8EF95
MAFEGTTSANGIWHARGGEGEELVVLLHGLAANAAVFAGLAPLAAASGRRWLAPDFRGHGRSVMHGPYGYGVHAADIALLLDGENPEKTIVLGHSFGGVIGALLGSGLYGPPPARVVGLGVKLDWSADEEDGARRLAAKPPKLFAARGEATEHALKIAGLAGLVDPGSETAAHGVLEREGGFAAAFDPAAFGAVGPSIDALMRGCRAPLALAAGERDPMVSREAMTRTDPGAVVLPDLGHNAHVEAPDVVMRLL